MARILPFSGAVLLALAALVSPAFAGSAPTAGAPPSSDAQAETRAQARAPLVNAALAKAMNLDATLEIMRLEGLDYGAGIAQRMFPGKDGAAWHANLARIYAPDRLWASFGPAFDAALAGHDTAPILAFFQSGLGRKVVALEISARRAELDKSVEDMALQALAQMRAAQDPRLDLLREFIEANDLVELNVEGALNSNFAFYRGLEQGKALPRDMTEEQMLRDVWAQEDDIRRENVDWLYSYLALAYQPLSDDELRAYIAFSRTPGGRLINAALFAAFDKMFDDVSRALGQAAAREINGRDL